jgi:selenocysteine lyase/cysteine desulfurase
LAAWFRNLCYVSVHNLQQLDVYRLTAYNDRYEHELRHREEAGTPGIIESIRCGLAFHARQLVGPDRIEKLEGQFAKRAVDRWMKHGNIWVLGEEFSNISTEHRLSITSFNIRCVIDGKPLCKPGGEPLFLHPHFVAAVLNDVYGIQSRSGCSCAAPLGFRLFHYSEEQADMIASLAEKDGIHVSHMRLSCYQRLLEELTARHHQIFSAMKSVSFPVSAALETE